MGRNVRLRSTPFRAHSWAEWFAARADAKRETDRLFRRIAAQPPQFRNQSPNTALRF